MVQLKLRIAGVFFFFWYPSCFWGFSFEQSLLFIIHFLLGKLFSCLRIFVLNIFVSIVFFCRPSMLGSISMFTGSLSSLLWTYAWIVLLLATFVLQVLLSFILRGILSIGSFYTCISCVRAFFRP